MKDDDDLRRHLPELIFEWDENKRRNNISKHGIDFLDVPSDPAQYTYRSKHPKHETRYVTIGAMQGRIVAVVSTLRDQKLRIISVRVARKNERDRYG